MAPGQDFPSLLAQVSDTSSLRLCSDRRPQSCATRRQLPKDILSLPVLVRLGGLAIVFAKIRKVIRTSQQAENRGAPRRGVMGRRAAGRCRIPGSDQGSHVPAC